MWESLVHTPVELLSSDVQIERTDGVIFEWRLAGLLQPKDKGR